MPLNSTTLHWRHNDHDGVSNHQPHGCLLNRLFRRRSKKTSKLRVIGLGCVGNSPGPVNSPHKEPVTRKMFPFDDVIMDIVNLYSIPQDIARGLLFGDWFHTGLIPCYPLVLLYYRLLPLTRWDRDKIAAIWQTTFSNAFYWMEMHEFRLRFHWSLFLRFEWLIFQHWFR